MAHIHLSSSSAFDSWTFFSASRMDTARMKSSKPGAEKKERHADGVASNVGDRNRRIGRDENGGASVHLSHGVSSSDSHPEILAPLSLSQARSRRLWES
jgi:hypothetical protein